MWNTASNPSFTDLNKLELKKILADNKNIIELRVDWRNIEKNFPKCKFTVDLSNDSNVIDLYWPQVKDRVSALFTQGQMTAGHINYDSDSGRVQVKDGNLPYCFQLENYEFIGCKIQGEVTYCDFFSCDVQSSDIHNSLKLESCDIFVTIGVRSSEANSELLELINFSFSFFKHIKRIRGC